MAAQNQLQLCYLHAGKVRCGASGDLEGVKLSSDTDEALGTLDGVVIDPAERRVRYFVVHRRGWFKSRRYLVPADCVAQIASDRRTLRLPVDPDKLTNCEEFDVASIPDYSDEHVLAAIFGRSAAA